MPVQRSRRSLPEREKQAAANRKPHAKKQKLKIKIRRI
nr:MAG TPA: hypothetical protein [Caudoviricetes sp.]